MHKLITSCPKTSCDLDPIPTFLVLELLDVLLTPITSIINLSLSEGSFPDDFKRALVKPLLKKSSLPVDDMKSYRPVSNLSFISKLLERVVAAQLKSHISNNNLDSSFQSAYKSSHSTETALLNIQDDIHNNMAKGRVTALTLLDLSAAFDTIDHKLLLERLAVWFGLGGDVLDWFSSYLTNRFQEIKLGSILSTPKSLSFGVPQGSVLGPLLFSLYTAPLSKIIACFGAVSHHLYADDTQIYISISPERSVLDIVNLQECLSAVQLWMHDNFLKLNPEKTEFILIGTKYQREKFSHLFPVDILGNSTLPADKVRNLGVIFDKNFSFSSHISNICKSCFYHIRDLRRIRRYLTRSVATTLANALVSSRLDYCNSLFYGISKQNKLKLQVVQNTLCRIVTRSSRFAHITPLRKELHWLPVSARINFKLCLLTYKALNFSQPTYLRDKLVYHPAQCRTRAIAPGSNVLLVPNYDRSTYKALSFLQQSFRFAAPTLWNKLPVKVRLAPSIGSFRRHLKAHLFDLAYPSFPPP